MMTNTTFMYAQGKERVGWDDTVFEEDRDAFVNMCNQYPLSAEEEADMKSSLVKALQACMVHYHKATCKKNKCEGTDMSCRMEYPRPLVTESEFGDDNCTFLLRRNHGNIVSYCSTWMKTIYGNHNFSLIPEQSRAERSEAIYRVLRAENPNVSASCFACLLGSVMTQLL